MANGQSLGALDPNFLQQTGEGLSVIRPDEASRFEGKAFLTPEQQALAQETFQTTVQPLRRGFEERLGTTLEQLSSRGVAFGGVGSESLRKLLEREQEQESQLAGQIGTGLGRTSLDQAFQASEAAKSRQLQSQLQQAGFEFQSGQADIERTRADEQRTLDLIQQGALQGPEVQSVVESIIGEQGLTFTNQDDLAIQRAARAAGLSVDEFTELRGQIGQGQLAAVIANPQNFIEDPERARNFQLQLANIAADAQRDAAKAGRRGGGILGGLFGAIGGTAGFIFSGGNPAAAAAGATIGSGLGTAIDNS